jgi:uncharacterized protein YecE (DUF72 family)
MAKRAQLLIGTSGWSYRHWRGPFYPADLPAAEHFAFYAERFSTVELNATFYRLPSPAAVAAWRAAAPRGFRFVVKGSRFITHNKKLADPARSLDRFATVVIDGLGPRIAAVLFQLPPRWAFAPRRLDDFLTAFRERCGRLRVAVEFRDASWYRDETLLILRRHDAAFCIYHLAGHQSPIAVTADFAYVRLHGSAGKYAGAYGHRGLAPWAERMRGWLAAGTDVLCYFDNDGMAAAPQDALLLRGMLGGQHPG